MSEHEELITHVIRILVDLELELGLVHHWDGDDVGAREEARG